MPAFFGPIEEQTLGNQFFRHVLFTGKYCQLVVMCLQPGEEIGNEVHENVDQFFRVEQGEARFVLNGSEEHLVHANEAAVIPAGTWQASVLMDRKDNDWGLFGALVVPGFEYSDFTLGKGSELAEKYPDAASRIKELNLM